MVDPRFWPPSFAMSTNGYELYYHNILLMMIIIMIYFSYPLEWDTMGSDQPNESEVTSYDRASLFQITRTRPSSGSMDTAYAARRDRRHCVYLVIALIGYVLASMPGLGCLGQLAWAILIAAVYRQLRGYPERLRIGINSQPSALRLTIILYGLKLNIGIVFQQGLGLMMRDVISVIFAIALTLLIAKWLKADMSLSLLLGIGTGICGAAAIAAVSPILKAKEKDTALGAGLIAFLGTIVAIGYTLVQPALPLTDTQYGVWSGVSLHEIAHVALAVAPAGEDALRLACSRSWDAYSCSYRSVSR